MHGSSAPARSSLALLVSLQTLLVQRLHGRDPERGDVPGWVLITLMTAGIVTVLWQFAGDRLLAILTNALDSVSGPGTSA